MPLTSAPTLPAHTDSFRFRLRLAASCLLLAGVALVQSPGLLVPDTKLDLVIAATDFLQRAAHLWDPEGAFGQLQNQAYGYLWPQGPFFALGELLGVPGWVTQRLWLALVICVAFVGSALLVRALGVRSDLACLLAAFAYALSPRMLTVLGPISIEAWPSALAPWVLLPLVIGASRGSPHRAAARSALAVAMVGGVNAAATSAVLPLGVLWLLTRERGARRRIMILWWPVFTLLGTLWWLVPLFVMGSYSPPFLDYIESAANTTFPTTMYDALRGTSNWVAYIDRDSRAGNDLIRNFYLPLNSGVLLVAGLAGLVLRRNPHRAFLLLGLVVGLLLVRMGHSGAVAGWFSGGMQSMLDGALAPLRNVHKFDPVLRLPLVIGLGMGVDVLLARAREERREGLRWWAQPHLDARGLVAVAVVATVGASLPAAFGRVTPQGGFDRVPDHWSAAADWLGQHQEEGVALLVPGTSFGTYLWGRPQDEPMQALATTPWAVRNAVPLTPAGNIRMLDEVESLLSQGRSSDAFGSYLHRAGVSYLVVRNDLERVDDIPDPVLVRQSLSESAGIQRVATFGEAVGGAAHLVDEGGERLVINGGWQDEYPALEIWEVVGTQSYATAAERPPILVGGPEDLLDVVELGLVGDAPVRLAADIAEEELLEPGTEIVLTDGLRSTERNFGRLHDAASATRARGQDRRLRGSVPDYQLADHDRWATWATYDGVTRVDASSAQSDADSFGGVEPGQQAFAAIDGRLDTGWVSGPDGPHWWRVDLEGSRSPGQVRITGAGSGRQSIRVLTEQSESQPVELRAGVTRTVPVGGPTTWVRVEDASGVEGRRLQLAEVSIPGVRASRPLVLPTLPEAWEPPRAVVLRRLWDARRGCGVIDLATRCVEGRDVSPEEPANLSRRFDLSDAGLHEMSLTVRPLDGSALEQLLTIDQPLAARASSAAVPDVRGGALAAIDGDPGTTWTPAQFDDQPTLFLNWLGQRRVASLSIDVAEDTAAAAPTRIRLDWPGGERVVELGADGGAQFAPIRTSQMSVTVLARRTVTDVDFDGTTRVVAAGISEIRLDGVPFFPLRIPEDGTTTECGTGPDVVVDGRRVRTRVELLPAAAYAGEQLEATFCGSSTVELGVGTHNVLVPASIAFAADTLVLTRRTALPRAAAPLTSQRPGPVQRIIDPDPAAGAVVTRENVNLGWRAEQSGDSLELRVFDGWRQGWDTEGAEPVTAEFVPDATYRAALAGGAFTFLILGVLFLVPARRWPSRWLDPLSPRRPGVGLLVLAGVLGAGLLAGWIGVTLAALGAVVGRVLEQRGLGFLVSLPLVASTGAYVVEPWGSDTGWGGQYAWVGQLVVLSLGGVLGALLAEPLRGRSLSFKKGSSTQR